ncbi:pepsin A-like [Xyrichtys novacula]|uniref:Pepsin A-like n=1 Tax=Xyrichtys novacula TaxID=13765 RepID=A0AAV1FFF7_XYRNO|nr:pepsin A-like [Xyrichtys novacula]
MRAHRMGRQWEQSSFALTFRCLRFTGRDRILKESRKNPVEIAGCTIIFTVDLSDHMLKLSFPANQ